MYLKRISAGLLSFILLFVSGYFAIPKANAISGLELARDIVSSTNTGTAYIQHEITFTLPVSAQQIRPADSILIEMPSYQNIILPTSFVGWYGQPLVSLEPGNTIKMTNVVMLPGTNVAIYGLIADNPGYESGFPITIKIGYDLNGNFIIRNKQTIVPSEASYYISVGAQIITPYTALDISGYSSPDSFISMSESGSIVGTTSTDMSGAFTMSLTAIESGAHAYTLGGSDSDNLSTTQTTVNVFLPDGRLTIVRGILLSPTITGNQTQIKPGDPITFHGKAKPQSNLNLFIESPLRSYSVLTDVDGKWSYTVIGDETKNYSPGEYRAYSIVQDEFSNQSSVSPTYNFAVINDDTDNPAPACDISKGDLNCDGKTNLTDFSILLFHWKTNHKKADINKDGSVNLTDFSIMMYYFKR